MSNINKHQQTSTQNHTMDVEELRQNLRHSVNLLGALNLTRAAKWAGEALVGLREPTEEVETSVKHKQIHNFETLPHRESDCMMLARGQFNSKEFSRCAYSLRKCQSPQAVFMRLHSTYIDGDRKREEESQGILGANDSKVTNANAPHVLKELSSLLESPQYSDDPFLLYLYGALLLKQKSTELATETLIKSIKLYPFNWSSWSELITSITGLDEAQLILHDLEVHFAHDFSALTMVRIGKIVIYQELFQHFEQLFKDLQGLLELFPNFAFIKTQSALVSYHALEYQQAENTFDSVLQQDPYCLDDMDTYSNILYVMDKKSKLSYLAQLANEVDKFRPETCCIIANYYSLKCEHEKAIMYYRRALALNRNCLAAWTLMGHEFVECKNSHAAIESYRRAIDTNPKDFKAWYGLGQAYEVLDMHLYSLYYYQQASIIKPHDRRIWIALGQCFDKLKKVEDSIMAYKRALSLSEYIDLSIVYKLALLYQTLGQEAEVYANMRTIYVEEVNTEHHSDETAKARIWLARHEMKQGNYSEAYSYAVDLTYGTSQEIEDARAITRAARNKMNN